MNRTTTQCRKSLTIVRVLAAAAAALALPAVAFGQGQIDAGRSNDASNRVGAGGRNERYTNIGQYSNYIANNGNRVVTGNVTSGREFRGNVGYTDPFSLRTPTAGLTSDNFIKNSAGVPQPYSREPIPNQSQPFYGASQTATPPPGFVLSDSRGGYVPAPRVTGPRGAEDQRLGIVDLNQPITPGPGVNTMVTRGTLTPGAADPTQAGIITGSTLYGVREWNPRDPADRLFLENMLRDQNNVFDRLHLDPREVQKMREEVSKTLGNDPADTGTGQGGKGGAAASPAQPGARRSADSLSLDPLGRTLGTPSDPKLNDKPLSDQVQTAQAEGADAQVGFRKRLLGQAQRTSTKYSELNKRLEEFNAQRAKTDADYAREFNAAVKAKESADKGKADPNKPAPAGGINNVAPVPGTGQPDVTKGGDSAGTGKAGTEMPVKPKVQKPAPMKIGALSEGVKAEGLANVMKKAEGLMKEGKFMSALDQYEAAEAVAPNNPLIWLGRANAELGAGLFARADAHLRQAFTADKALLMGQYDLRTAMGEQRLEKLVTDLKDLTNKDQKAVTPVWLLAYISYNSGNERMALGFLDLAEKRSGGQDEFFKSVREHWSLPEGEPREQQPANK
jgi:tetratricopeptide (TPR) repeat protein